MALHRGDICRLFCGLVTLLASLFQGHLVKGHGRLLEPPSRASAWRLGWKTPIDYNDNAAFCGGFYYQYQQHGKCGICGDAWGEQERPHEVPNLYATGTITKNYKQAQVIEAVVEITAFHRGYMEFKLCKHETFDSDPIQECFDSNILLTSDGKDKFYLPGEDAGVFTVSLRLPADLVCPTHCILQWTYVTGNNWGIDPVSGSGCIGCGPQENFRSCSDITIGGNNVSLPNTTDTDNFLSSTPAVEMKPQWTNEDGGGLLVCRPTPTYENNPGYLEWCNIVCNTDPQNCHPLHCICEKQPTD